MRLIDADALFNWGKHKLSDAVKYGNKDEEHQDFSYSTLMMYEIADEVNNAPTIDAVPVVRCRECIYRQKAKVNRKGFLICPASGMEITDDDYCSYGAKMESEVEHDG
jgi:hypothetical protein